MYVKLAFAVASHLDSEILVMDEVLAVGDMKFQKKCLGKMGDVAENEGRTVLYVSHNMATIRNLCTRCVVLSKGRIIYDGDVETAIQVYSDNNKLDFTTKLNNRNYERHTDDLGKFLFLKEVELLGKDNARYSTSEKMHIKLKWNAYEDIEKIKFGFSLKYVDSSNIGFSESNEFITAKKGMEYESIFDFDLSNLAEGIYYLCLNMFIQDASGGLHSMDQAEKIYFEVMEPNGKRVTWQRQYWGSIRLNELCLSQNYEKQGIKEDDI